MGYLYLLPYNDGHRNVVYGIIAVCVIGCEVSGGWGVCTHSSQSTATMRLMSETGRPTDVRTRIIITSPALGMLAAPMLASVAVRLTDRHTV